MPGVFSTIFDDGGDSSQSAQTQSYDLVVEGGQTVDLDLDVGLEVGGTFENPDGSTTTWSNSQDVSLDTDVDASFQAVLSADADRSSFDADAG